MDTVKKYQQIIIDYFESFAARRNKNPNPAKIQVIADTQRNHYQLIKIGWVEYKYIHSCLFHLDIIDGKIWIQENRTETLIDEELVERGIPKHDIVLGVIHPSRRKDTEYAVA